jgi:uncharacterized membrane protein
VEKNGRLESHPLARGKWTLQERERGFCMNRIYVQSEYIIPATPEEVYESLVDFQNARPSILTSNFVDYHVEQGGVGEGTVIRYHLKAAGRKRPYRMHITEPIKGKILTERDSNSSLVTTWTLRPVNNGQQTQVRLVSEWEGVGGIGGFFERTFAPRGLGSIYDKMLSRLAQKLHSSSETESSAEKPVKVAARAAILGLVAGIRSMTPLALLSWISPSREEGASTVEQLLKSPAGRATTAIAALGEIIADKFPVIPSRTNPVVLLGRVMIGGVAGMILCRRLHQPLVLGIISGATGAGIGSIASTSSRAWLSRTTKTPQALWGGVEDILALGLGILTVRTN